MRRRSASRHSTELFRQRAGARSSASHPNGRMRARSESRRGRRRESRRRGGMMQRHGWIGASVLGLAAAVLGSDSTLETAQSFTIPTLCTDAARCAAFCSSVIEQGRSEQDFVALAAYQLGPPKAIDLPPANLSMPAPVDPINVYAGTGAGMFSPAVAGHLAR